MAPEGVVIGDGAAKTADLAAEEELDEEGAALSLATGVAGAVAVAASNGGATATAVVVDDDDGRFSESLSIESLRAAPAIDGVVGVAGKACPLNLDGVDVRPTDAAALTAAAVLPAATASSTSFWKVSNISVGKRRRMVYIESITAVICD